MLYSGARQLRHQLPLCFIVLLLSGCGGGANGTAEPSAPTTTSSQDSNNSTSQSTTATINVSAGEGGYVVDANTLLYCDSANEFCDARSDSGSIEQLTAVSRYGYRFSQWQKNSSVQPDSDASLALIVKTDVSIKASFQQQSEISQPGCTAPEHAERFRSLHLGDSLTVAQCWKTNCISYFAKGTQEAEREAIRFYETAMASNAEAPRTIAVGGNRINGTNISLSFDGVISSGFESYNFWQWSLDMRNEMPEDFDAVVVALGTNDIVDTFYGTSDLDTIFDDRVRPLLQWLGDRPVFWIMPHYSLKPVADSGVNLYARTDGIACSCGDAPATTSCNLAEALAQCNAGEEQARETVRIFRDVHAFRKRLLELQGEYPNLHIIDAEQLIAEQSQGRYDLYQQLRDDKLHFTEQGVEWYAWAHAYLGQSANTACPRTAPQWTMSAAENAMMLQIEALP